MAWYVINPLAFLKVIRIYRLIFIQYLNKRLIFGIFHVYVSSHTDGSMRYRKRFPSLIFLLPLLVGVKRIALTYLEGI
jgi:hypothetical protein